MSTDSNLLKSGVGEIVYMAVEKPVKVANRAEPMYTIKLALDPTENKTFIDAVKKLNKAKVVTAKTYRGESEAIEAILATGKVLISSSSQFKPTCFDSEKNELEENPWFFKESTGTAQMIVEPYEGEKGGTINLLGVVIHSLHTPEGSGTMTREERVARLRAMAEE